MWTGTRARSAYTRKKLKSRGTSIKPALIRFGAEIEAILKRRPAAGSAVSVSLHGARRATGQRSFTNGALVWAFQGVSLHSYRYAWAERALKCGYPERFAQQALGHNSKAVHHAYSKHAEVTVPSLDDWENDWQKNPQRGGQPKLVAVDFRSLLPAVAQSN